MSCRRSVVVLVVELWLAVGALAASAASPPAQAHLCDAQTIFLKLQKPSETIWPEPASSERYVVTLYRLPADPVARLDVSKDRALIDEATAERSKRGTLLRVRFGSDLPAGEDLLAVVDVAGQRERRRVAVAEVSTKPKAVVRPAPAQAQASDHVEVLSRTPLEPLPNPVTVVEIRRPAGVIPTAGGGVRRVEEEVVEHRACAVPQDRPCCAPDGGATPGPESDSGSCLEPKSTETLASGFTASDSAFFCIAPGERWHRSSNGLRLEGLQDVFGQTVRAEGKIPSKPVPKGADDARYFVRALFESADGEDDAFALDLKLKPSFRMEGGWLFRPELTASVARNVPKATDSVRIVSLFSRYWNRRTEHLVGHTVSVGPGVEADRDLDRINGLLELRWRPDLKGLFQPRAARRDRVVTAEGLKPDTVRLPPWGWGLSGWLGLEAGSSVEEQTVESVEGGATLSVPSYEILRLRSRVQAFIEYRRLTLAVQSGLRYLFTDELVSRQAEDGSLRLVEIDQARPYTEASINLALDRTGNLGLELTYKDGSEPPLYSRVEKYSFGVVAKY